MLADRLIQDQVRCAQQEEQICILRQKVASSSKQSSSDVSPQVLYSARLVGSLTIMYTRCTLHVCSFLMADAVQSRGQSWHIHMATSIFRHARPDVALVWNDINIYTCQTTVSNEQLCSNTPRAGVLICEVV